MDKLLTIDDLVRDRQLNALRMFQHQADPEVSIIRSLKCGLTGKRLVTPARGMNCNHTDCVELKELLNYALRIQKWECPLCMNPLPYYQIYIDLQCKQILVKLIAKNDTTTMRVEVWEDGNWQIPTEASGQAAESNLFDDDSTEPISVSHFLAPAAAPEDAQLDDYVKKEMVPNLCVGFPWNSTEAVVFDFSQIRWLRMTNYRNKLRQYTNFQMVHTPNSVFIIGGIDTNYTQIPNVYEFSSRGLNRRTSMGIPRSHFAYAYSEGFIYVLGGVSEGARLSHCEKYGVDSDTWIAMAAMPHERGEHVATMRNQDEIIVLGGSSSEGLTNKLFRYTIPEDLWTTLNVDLPRPIASPYHITLPDQRVLILFGGMESAVSGKSEISNHIQVLKMSTYQWELNVPVLQIPIAEPNITPVFDSQNMRVHIITGVDEGYHLKFELRKLLPDVFMGFGMHIANDLLGGMMIKEEV